MNGGVGEGGTGKLEWGRRKNRDDGLEEEERWTEVEGEEGCHCIKLVMVICLLLSGQKQT